MAQQTRNKKWMLIIDGSYAEIGADKKWGKKVDYFKLRQELEKRMETSFVACLFFNQVKGYRRGKEIINPYYQHLQQSVLDGGPEFQLKLYPMKEYMCNCPSCGTRFTQMVQKGVDNGIATSILSNAYEGGYDNLVLFAGDGDFRDSLDAVKTRLSKQIWIIGYKHSVSNDLQRLADRTIFVQELWGSVQSDGLLPKYSSSPRPVPTTVDRELERVLKISEEEKEMNYFKEKEQLAIAMSLEQDEQQGPWACPVCTFENSALLTACEMCCHEKQS